MLVFYQGMVSSKTVWASLSSTLAITVTETLMPIFISNTYNTTGIRTTLGEIARMQIETMQLCCNNTTRLTSMLLRRTNQNHEKSEHINCKNRHIGITRHIRYPAKSGCSLDQYNSTVLVDIVYYTWTLYT